MIACYDLQHRLPTYDFFCWLTHVRLLGATAITISRGRKFFMRKKWRSEETEKRLAHYLLPGPALAALPCCVGEDGNREIGSHLVPDLWREILRHDGKMPRLKSVLPPGDARYTVTIREHFHRPERNSDPQLWREFAQRIGARVFEEHDVAPVSLYERVAAYAGARMNFGVPNGPLSLLWWSRYPLCQFCDPETTARAFERQSIPLGTQVPWFLPNQRLIWEKPSMDGLMREFEAVDYDATDDFAKSINACYQAVRERKAGGGPGWGE